MRETRRPREAARRAPGRVAEAAGRAPGGATPARGVGRPARGARRVLLAAGLAAAAPLAPPLASAAALQDRPPAPDPPSRRVAPDDASLFGGAIGPLIHADRTDAAPELVLYPGGDALVRERIGFELRAGLNTISWPDAPDALDPTSLSLTFPGEPPPDVLSSVHRPAAAGPDDALRGLVGSVVEVVTDGGDRLRGRLLSARDALVLEVGGAGSDAAASGAGEPSPDDAGADGDGAARRSEGGRAADGDVVVLPRGEVRSFRIPDLPPTFRTDPEVGWTVRAPEPGAREAELAYLAGGLSWDAHYVMEVDRSDERADLAGWAGLENRTDRTYRDARVKLVAGDVRRAPDGRAADARALEAAAADRGDGAGPAGAAERAFGELRLFELPRAATLPAGATVRSLLFRADAVPVRRELVVVGGLARPLRGARPSLSPDAGSEEATDHARVRYALSTAGDGGVGRDLPSGRVRVYREDEDGTLLLAGEDVVGDVPRGDSVRVETGRSFRVTRTRVQTDYRRPDPRSLEEDFRLSLRNDRDEAVELRVLEKLHRWDEWEVTRSRLDGEAAEPRRLDVRTVAWRVPLAAGSERELTYTVRYTFPAEGGR